MCMQAILLSNSMPLSFLKAAFSILFSLGPHYSDVIISAVASQITGAPIVYSTVCSGTDQRKHQSPASMAFMMVIHTGER